MKTLVALAGAADDGLYQTQRAVLAMKHLLNEIRDDQLNEAETIALFEVYNETGR